MLYALPITPPAEGGINIIHFIGKGVNKKILPFLKGKTSIIRPNKLYLGYFEDKGKIIDEVIINLIPAKQSLSGLDTVEINSHGSVLVADKIISALKKSGIKIITTQQLLKLALKNRRVNSVQKGILESLLSAKTELACRFFLQRLAKPSKQPPESKRMEKLFNHPRRIVLVGKANSGKSTLFNVLAGQKRVIEHPTPGTTRDVVEETIAIKGIPFVLADTAGWLKGNSINTKRIFRKGDIIIYMVDGSKRREKAEETVNHLGFTALNPTRFRERATILAINKCDLPKSADLGRLKIKALSISALKRIGIEPLTQKILSITKKQLLI
ncbi:MAG: GTP-binding protein [Planctomycetes bacterium]|nr:GTP-binding protein [Planctomycetota bacterium]